MVEYGTFFSAVIFRVCMYEKNGTKKLGGMSGVLPEMGV